MSILHVGDVTMDYMQHSEGATPVIFIHGIVSSQYTWGDFPLRFKQYGGIITLSLPGHYPATFPGDMRQETISDAWVGDTMAQAIEQITGGQPAILIGHSTGGYATIATAWRAPRLVKYAISLAGFARGIWTGTLGLAQRFQHLGGPGSLLFNALITSSSRNSRLVDFSWRQSSYDKQGFQRYKQEHMQMSQLMSHLSHLDNHALRMWFYQMYRAADLTPHLAQIVTPVLAIAGQQDTIVPPGQTVLIANGVADGTCVLLDKMGHALFAEQPERVQDRMTRWLDERLAAVS
ncbi:MAG: alpha/beta hydrolase [Chloroflexota bacterium]|nr:alpha/beta hydrolase [Chloroflexota bacterium]